MKFHSYLPVSRRDTSSVANDHPLNPCAPEGRFVSIHGLPYFVALLVILIESIGALMIVTGFFTRFAALGIFGLFAVIALKFHSDHGFFMNWTGSQKGEGLEYFIMVLGLSLILIFSGGGKASVDAALQNNKKLSLA